MAAPNFPGFNRVNRSCGGNWFSDPSEFRVGTQYWFRDFDTGEGTKLQFVGTHEVYGDYQFTHVPPRYYLDGVERVVGFDMEDLAEDGCFREIVNAGAGGYKKTRRAPRTRKYKNCASRKGVKGKSMRRRT
jgi:hypothetical protein